MRSAKIIEEYCSFSSVSVEPLSETVSEETSISDTGGNLTGKAGLSCPWRADEKPNGEGCFFAPVRDASDDIVLDKVGVFDEDWEEFVDIFLFFESVLQSRMKFHKVGAAALTLRDFPEFAEISDAAFVLRAVDSILGGGATGYLPVCLRSK